MIIEDKKKKTFIYISMRYLRSDIIQDFSRKGDITKENIAATWGCWEWGLYNTCVIIYLFFDKFWHKLRLVDIIRWEISRNSLSISVQDYNIFVLFDYESIVSFNYLLFKKHTWSTISDLIIECYFCFATIRTNSIG